MPVKTLHLLSILRKYLSEFLIERQGTAEESFTLFRIGIYESDKGKISQCFNELCTPYNQEEAYIINMQELDFVSPSAAKALMLWAIAMIDERNVPVMFSEVGIDALQGLQTIRNDPELASDKCLWAVDSDGSPHVIGMVPDRLQEILKALKAKGEVSASVLAEENGDTSKKNVTRFSVYLQEVFNSGLVVREKVAGSNRTSRTNGERGERGWTYIYRPVFSLLTSPTTRMEVTSDGQESSSQ